MHQLWFAGITVTLRNFQIRFNPRLKSLSFLFLFVFHSDVKWMGIITKSWLLLQFALILNHSFMLSLVVNSTLIALPGDKSLQPVINVHSSLYADVNVFWIPQ